MTPSDAAPVRPTRPTIVTVAFWLQLAAVAVLLVLIALLVVEAVRYDGQIDRAVQLVPDADPMEVSDERSGNVVGALFLGVPALLLAVWLAATALPLARGSNTARILVFVAAGAQLLLCLGQGCMGALVIPFALGAGFSDPGFDPSEGMPPDGGDWEQSKFLDTLYGLGDSEDVVFGVGGIAVLMVLALTAAVVVLLLLPDAKGWFRPAPAAPAGSYPMALGYGYPPFAAMPPYGYGYPPVPPPGYLLCPDPALHLAHPPTGATPSSPPEVPLPGSETADGPGKPPADPTADPLDG
ncbi:MAG: hypothetical protein WA890_23650 [Micromonospora sp.]